MTDDAHEFLLGRPELTPTDEQQLALDAFRAGRSLVIEAGAGTGKTSTLKLLAETTTRRGQYVAFNKAIVSDAGAKMPGNFTCSTAHSLAFRAIGQRYAHRLKSPRMRSMDIARRLGIDPLTVSYGSERKPLAAGYLAGLAMRAVVGFCQSADPEPLERHVPYVDGIDLPTPDGRRGYANNREVRLHLLPAIRRAWADLQATDGQLPFRHDHYLKAWQLTGPRLAADVVMFDEAQDANPVIAAVIAAQDHAQRVYVGDSQQQIYEFTGAINAMDGLDGDRVLLTQSFRFGPAVATIANRVLETLDTAMRLRGTPTIASVVGPVAEPAAILCRSNACAVRTVLTEQAAGAEPHIVGGGTEVVAFAKAARDLMGSGFTAHPDLACFTGWGEVREYVENDAQGGELKLLVDLVDEFTVDTILDALERRMPAEAAADIVVSTAHKAKGREWPSVVLAGDFPDEEDDTAPGERRLLYVAATRARLELDVDAVPWLLEPSDVAAGATRLPPAVLEAPQLDPVVPAGRSCCLHVDDRHGPGVCCLHPHGCPTPALTR